MMTELLDTDTRIRVFGELEALFDNTPRHHRLRPAAEVRKVLARSGAALNVVKPLVESHRCAELLELQPGAVALWMFRHYEDVSSSNLRRFGLRNGVDNLRPVHLRDPDDWRNAGLSDETRELVSEHFSEHMSPYDAAALFWYCRNSLFDEQQLLNDERVRTCRYESLVAEPDAMVREVYGWVGLSRGCSGALETVHARSVGKGAGLEISDPVRVLCDSMSERLTQIDAVRSVQRAATT